MKTDIQMVEYLTECALATVEKMAMVKRSPKGEFKRQITIAQTGITHLDYQGEEGTLPRCHEIIGKYRGKVEPFVEEITEFWKQQRARESCFKTPLTI